MIRKYISGRKAKRNAACVSEVREEPKKVNKKKLITAGIICGVALALASGLQQWGIFYNSEILNVDATGKAGFLTALYIIFVPLCGMLFGRKAGASIIIGIVCGAVGMYFLCVTGNSSFTLGDLMMIGMSRCIPLHYSDNRPSCSIAIRYSFVYTVSPCATVSR